RFTSNYIAGGWYALSIAWNAGRLADRFFQSFNAFRPNMLTRCPKQFVRHFSVRHPALDKSTLQGVGEACPQEVPLLLRQRLRRVNTIEQSSGHTFRFFTTEFVDVTGSIPSRTRL